MKEPAVYIMTNASNAVLYTGVTSDLEARVQHHKLGVGSKFTSTYKCTKLVYFQSGGSMDAAIEEEKRIKAGSRARKVELVESINPDWRDLSEGWNI